MTSASSKSSLSEFASVHPKIESLISDTTKRSFLSSSTSNPGYSHQPLQISEHSDIKIKSSYVPLLPKRHFDNYSDDTSFSNEHTSRLKWKIPDENILKSTMPVHDANSAVPTSSLLSKVDVDDVMEITCTPSSSHDGNQVINSRSQAHFNLDDRTGALPSNSINKPHIKTLKTQQLQYDHGGGGDMAFYLNQPSETFQIDKREQSSDSSSTNHSNSSSFSSSNYTSSAQSSYIVNEPTFSSQDSARAAGYPIILKDFHCNTTVKSNLTENCEDHMPLLSSKSMKSSDMVCSTTISNPENKKKFVKWTDFHSYYSPYTNEIQQSSVSPSQVPITEQFRKLIEQLEVVKTESLQHNVLNHVDLSKAIDILKQVANNKSISSETPTVVDSSSSQTNLADNDNVKNTGSKELLTQDYSPSKLSNQTFAKSQPEFIGQLHNNMRRNEINNIGNRVGYKKSIDESTVEHKTKPELNSQQKLFLNGKNQSEFGDSQLQNFSVTYDTFSSNVKTSSTSSTPCKAATNNHSTGFEIIDEKTPPGKLAKKKEQFLLGRLKKEEEHRRIQMEREIEAEKRKLDAKQQQEKINQKKQEEKEKRDKIFKEYQKRKIRAEKAALHSPGVIGSKSPSSFTKKTNPLSKMNSYSSDHLHMLGNHGSNQLSSNMIPSTRIVTFSAPNAHEEDTDSLESVGSAEYTGPKLFKHLRSKSNRTLITNAINHCCLSGKVNEKLRNKTLKALKESECRHLMVLFRDNNCQFRSLYSYHPDEEKLHKICGSGPNVINPSMIEALFKYNSGRRAFVCIPSKTLSVSIDGITIKNSLWQHAIKK